MTVWARIAGDDVVELTEVNPVGRFHPDLVWVEVPVEWENLIAPRCRYVTGTFRPPLERDPATNDELTTDDVEWLRGRARESIIQIAAAARVACAKTSDPLEVAGWPAKAELAARYVASTTDAADDEALLAEATLRGDTVADLVTRIQTKAALYKPAVGKIDGWQSKAEKAVAAASDAATLVADLAQLKADAESALVALLTTMDS